MAAAAGHGAAFSHGADTVQPHCYNLLPFSFLFSVLTDELDPTDGFSSKKGRPSSSIPNSVNAPVLLESDNETEQISQMLASSSIGAAAEEVRTEGNSKYTTTTPLKESIGHTEFEVIAGALLGLFVSLAVNAVV